MEREFEKWMGEATKDCLRRLECLPVEAQVLLIARYWKYLDINTHVIGVALANHPWDRQKQCEWIRCQPHTLQGLIADGEKLRSAPIEERQKRMTVAEGILTPHVLAKVRRRLGLKAKRQKAADKAFFAPHDW